jgi:uncharacterized repeat protein (TIGR04002 family)
VRYLQKKSDIGIKAYAEAAVFAAVIMVATAFVRVPGPLGFMHLGDAVIFLAAVLLPTPLAAAASALGAGAADIIAGYPVYIIPTIIIKALMTLPFKKADYRNNINIITLRNIIACIISTVIGAGGYLLTELILYGNGAFLSLPFNFIQEAAGVLIFIAIGSAIDRSDVKKIFKN